ncbi:hypothetical protein D3C71_1186780 [compost metagenome]
MFQHIVPVAGVEFIPPLRITELSFLKFDRALNGRDFVDQPLPLRAQRGKRTRLRCRSRPYRRGVDNLDPSLIGVLHEPTTDLKGERVSGDDCRKRHAGGRRFQLSDQVAVIPRLEHPFGLRRCFDGFEGDGQNRQKFVLAQQVGQFGLGILPYDLKTLHQQRHVAGADQRGLKLQQ